MAKYFLFKIKEQMQMLNIYNATFSVCVLQEALQYGEGCSP